MVAIELVTDRIETRRPTRGTSAVAAACHAAGLVGADLRTYGNVLRASPATLIIPNHLLGEGLAAKAAVKVRRGSEGPLPTHRI
jgi:4-aminobutyrate aminotransferase/(S)-3-amino-2-methylpropionate transaminase